MFIYLFIYLFLNFITQYFNVVLFHSRSFNITDPTYIEIEAAFDFLTGALTLELSGRLPRGSLNRHVYQKFYPSFAAGYLFFNKSNV